VKEIEQAAVDSSTKQEGQQFTLYATMEHPDLTFRLLEQITDKFSEERKLGQGAFGTVYRVRLSAYV